MNDETTQVTSALALGTVFANDELRASVEAYIRELIRRELSQAASHEFSTALITNRAYDIERIALRALKQHFINASNIY